MNRDKPLVAPRFGSKEDLLQIKNWLEKAGLNSDDDSLLYGIFHLGTGIGYPINRDLNLNVEAGPSFRLGITF